MSIVGKVITHWALNENVYKSKILAGVSIGQEAVNFNFKPGLYDTEAEEALTGEILSYMDQLVYVVAPDVVRRTSGHPVFVEIEMKDYLEHISILIGMIKDGKAVVQKEGGTFSVSISGNVSGADYLNYNREGLMTIFAFFERVGIEKAFALSDLSPAEIDLTGEVFAGLAK